MTDSLRDRIAAVIRREVPCHPPAADRIADAVIAALGLRPETGRNVVWCSSGLTDKASRYVTEWTTDE